MNIKIFRISKIFGKGWALQLQLAETKPKTTSKYFCTKKGK